MSAFVLNCSVSITSVARSQWRQRDIVAAVLKLCHGVIMPPTGILTILLIVFFNKRTRHEGIMHCVCILNVFMDPVVLLTLHNFPCVQCSRLWRIV